MIILDLGRVWSQGVGGKMSIKSILVSLLILIAVLLWFQIGWVLIENLDVKYKTIRGVIEGGF